MLDDRAARLLVKRVSGEESTLQVQKIVEGELLPAFLLERGDSVVPSLYVKRSSLAWILSVPKRSFLQEWNADTVGKYLLPLAAEPIRDRRVVRRRTSENLFSEEAAEVKVVVLLYTRVES